MSKQSIINFFHRASRLRKEYSWLVFGRFSVRISAGTPTCTILIFLNSFEENSGSYLNIDHDPFLPHSMEFIIHYHPIIWCYPIWITDRIITHTTYVCSHYLKLHIPAAETVSSTNHSSATVDAVPAPTFLQKFRKTKYKIKNCYYIQAPCCDWDYVPERAGKTKRKTTQIENFIACNETWKDGKSDRLGYNNCRTCYVIKCR
jgi:hypothetical protein